MDKVELIKHWRFRAHRVQLAHYESARKFRGLHLKIGIPAIALSTLVGTSIFASLGIATGENWFFLIKIATGLLSVSAAVLMGLQTFLKYAEQAEKHRTSGARFAHLKQEIELLATLPPSSDEELSKSLKAIEAKWTQYREASPNFTQKIWSKIEKELTFQDQNKRYKDFGKNV